MAHIYGPVPSRRLGLSLGVDLVPPKTCDYDCIYCRLGRTSNWTARIEPYVRLTRKVFRHGKVFSINDYTISSGNRLMFDMSMSKKRYMSYLPEQIGESFFYNPPLMRGAINPYNIGHITTQRGR